MGYKFEWDKIDTFFESQYQRDLEKEAEKKENDYIMAAQANDYLTQIGQGMRTLSHKEIMTFFEESQNEKRAMLGYPSIKLTDAASVTEKIQKAAELDAGEHFGKVNIHTDDSAAEKAENLGARAYTYGNDIYFNKGEFQPETAKGQHIIAHEMGHVGQQKKSGQKRIQRKKKKKHYPYSPWYVYKKMYEAGKQISEVIAKVQKQMMDNVKKACKESLLLPIVDPRKDIKNIRQIKQDINNFLNLLYRLCTGGLNEIDGVFMKYGVPLPDAFVIGGSKSKNIGIFGGELGFDILLIKNYGAVLYGQGGGGVITSKGVSFGMGPVWGMLGDPGRYEGRFFEYQVGALFRSASGFGNYSSDQGWVFGTKWGLASGASFSFSGLAEYYIKLWDPHTNQYPDVGYIRKLYLYLKSFGSK